ncbi:putative radical SAM protein YgiQ [Faecalicoccus acidiformans]|uniref:Putative radical SAM protein YgiQ n=1 Tax=Faecalicoccus acidiformans TaxID=915173 RepID=A0A7W8D3Y8_9FIRM|nr:YgiQ family radical SAM protein [Faecalicoccus acidiformans]MBB5185524.1 putative radical SAM protein YgiQ [Faecalicoccus acidiformans]
MSFLPTTRDEMLEQGYEQVDFVYVSGDAYVDHPSFGCAIITRTLQAYGYSCAVLAQPDRHKDEEFLQFGKPRLGFLVSAGNIDSMVNHYSVNKRRRDKDAYSDQGIMGKRPDRPTIVYTQILKRLFPDIPILIGGIEASLRRLAHYDYWDDKVRRSILIDSQADLLMFGMGENTIIEVAEALDGGLNVKDICYIRGTVWKTKSIESIIDDYILLPDYETICHDKYAYARSFMIQYENQDAIQSKILIEPYDGWYVVCNQPPLPLTQEQMDFTYSLPYERTFHPKYTYVPAIEEVQFSITSNRGCFGSCAFCAITSHQGRVISSRSTQSVVEEAKKIIEMPNFKGYIHDLGGPSANFSRPACDKQTTLGACAKRQCLWPKPCPNLKVDHTHYVEMLDAIRELPKVKKVFIRSGIRYDYLMYDKDETFFDRLIQYHISGQLKVAPEHVSAAVLDKMGKPRKELYLKFVDKYYEKNKQWGMKQYLVPYLMSSHPGCELKDAIELACYLKKIHHIPKQVQDFYPTPGTLATCMYYTGLDPRNMKPVYVAKTFEEKLEQRALMQYSYPKNYDIVYRALKKACRDDLIGSGPKCLIPAKRPYQKHKKERTKKRDVR